MDCGANKKLRARGAVFKYDLAVIRRMDILFHPAIIAHCYARYNSSGFEVQAHLELIKARQHIHHNRSGRGGAVVVHADNFVDGLSGGGLGGRAARGAARREVGAGAGGGIGGRPDDGGVVGSVRIHASCHGLAICGEGSCRDEDRDGGIGRGSSWCGVVGTNAGEPVG